MHTCWLDRQSIRPHFTTVYNTACFESDAHRKSLCFLYLSYLLPIMPINKIVSLLHSMLIFISLAVSSHFTQAQIAASPAATKVNTIDEMLPDLIKADTLDKALALFKPAPNKALIIKSDYLLLDSPAIAPAGIMPVRLMSEIPGTEVILLFNTTPATGEPSFLIAQGIPNLGRADIRVKIKLSKNADLIMVVRAAGKWYSVTNDVKVASK